MRQPGYPIETERLRLRPFVAEDVDDLHAIMSLPEVVRYLYLDVRTREQTQAMIATRAQQTALNAEGDRLTLALELRETGRVIGDVILIWTSEPHRQGETGFVLHPANHGRGLAREAAVEMLRLGFERFRLHRIIGRCDARNTDSARLMERLGMRREAHLLENELVKGEWTDEFAYAIRVSEWMARSRA
jgi:RimJ/RimL family protein N-acetyltransferase